MIKLDYSLESPEERKELVEKILDELEEEPSPQYLEILANYLILCMEKQEKKQKKIITENRLATITKRETSFEGLVSQFENGEDGVYNLITKNKNVIFQPKVSITKQDLDEIPPLRQLKEAISLWETKLKASEGKQAFTIKKALIEMRKDQYVIKNAYKQPISITKLTRGKYFIKLDEKIKVTKNGKCIVEGVSCLNPKICEATLCNYEKLKQAAHGNFESDLWYFMYDFDLLLEKALENDPLYQRIVQYKIQGLTNDSIQKLLQKEFNMTHTVEYISSLWRNKIPKMIASVAEDQYLDWYYLQVEKGRYKKCSHCGQIKLAHTKYFSKNKTSKDGFYSLCKKCRNEKAKQKKQVVNKICL